MLRSNPHAALYSQLASPYASHLYGMMPGAPPNLSGLHERMKLEEEHRARIAREEEKARIAREEEKQREREREMREKEMREREQREKEMREREQREKEMRERELREKEMREREQREREHREREMREKEMREREKLLQQHHFMQQQRNPYNLLGLFPQMVGLRPPSSMHPGYPMHHSLLGLPLPNSIPTSLSNSLSLPHHSQSQTGSSSSPITSSSSMNPSMSLMTSMGLNHAAHGLPHGLSSEVYHRLSNLPPPAHHYSPLPPPTQSPSSINNNSYGHPLMNPATSPQPLTRSPSSSSVQQSLNLSKNSSSSISAHHSKPVETRNPSEALKPANATSNTSLLPSIATVSVPSMHHDKNFKIEIASNGNSATKDVNLNSGAMKTEAKDLSALKTVIPKEQSPVDDFKPIIIEKPGVEPVKTETEIIDQDEMVEKIKEENKIKAENPPQDLSPSKGLEKKEPEAENKLLSSNDNKTIESEKATESSEAKDLKEEDIKVEEKSSVKDETNDENNASTKNNETSNTSSKK